MKERWKLWKTKSLWNAGAGRLPRLGRGTKVAINLAVMALAGLWLWGLAGYPLPTAELEFRRLERAGLENRSEIVLSLDRNLNIQARDGSWHCFVRSMVVGVTEDRVLVGYAGRVDRPFDKLRCYEREDGLTPIPLHPNFVSWKGVVQEGQEDDSYNLSVPLLLVGAPEEAASGGIELELTDWEGWEFRLDARLFDLGNGIWLAPVEQPEDVFSATWYRRVDYTLRLYDEGGALLLEQEGTVPQAL